MKQAIEKLVVCIQSAKREHLSLNVPKFLDECAKQEFRHLSENVVQAAGSEWKLVARKYNAMKHKDKAGRLFLLLTNTSGWELAVDYELDLSFRLSNADPSKDIRKAGKESLPLKFLVGSTSYGQLLVQEIEFKDLTDPKGGFVREDGSIHMELDFTIVNATVEGVPLLDARIQSVSKLLVEGLSDKQEGTSSTSNEDKE